jgi:hypothetical protein
MENKKIGKEKIKKKKMIFQRKKKIFCQIDTSTEVLFLSVGGKKLVERGVLFV